MMGGAPHPDPSAGSFSVADVDTSRFVKHRGALVLEHLEGATWVEMGRYGTTQEASNALDDQIGQGARADHLRLRPLTAAKSPGWKFWER